ncbi:hypothetical protein Sbal183_2572 [Shewanella baltica OS183]|nr:hypothetical protein Sbal175_1731 [Shewanella baltica BA175]EHQ15464.1 hypothetical protein Sbal183_2572 [Shewanella baltica OS183]
MGLMAYFVTDNLVTEDSVTESLVTDSFKKRSK